MKKKLSLIIIIIVFIAIIIGASLAYNHLSKKNSAQNLASQGETVENDAVDDQAADSNEEPESAAIDFVVEDGDGNEVKLSDFHGKPVVLNFWASWCGPCRAEMPDYDEIYKEYGEEIHFVMVNVTDGSRETVDTAKAFIAEEGYSFPVYYDTTLSASYTFGATSLPSSFFIDAEGNVIARATGTISKDVMQQGIDMIYSAE